MLVEEVDTVGEEALQGLFGDVLDVRGPAVQPAPVARIRIDVEAELGGDHDLSTHRGERFAHQLLVGEGSIDLGLSKKVTP